MLSLSLQFPFKRNSGIIIKKTKMLLQQLMILHNHEFSVLTIVNTSLSISIFHVSISMHLNIHLVKYQFDIENV